MKIFKGFTLKRTIIGTLAFGLSMGASLFLTPKRFIPFVDDQTISEEEDTAEENVYFNKLVQRVTGAVSKDSEETIPGMILDLNDVTIKFPSKTSVENNISIDGNIYFLMHSLDDIQFSVDLEADYNSKKIDLGIAYTNSTFYLDVKDLKIKSSEVSTQEVISKIYNLFFDTENEEGMGINLDIDDLINGVIGGLDLNSLMSGAGDLQITETEISDELEEISLGMHTEAVEEGDLAIDLDLKIGLYKESITLAYVNLGTIKIGDVEISGSIDCDTQEDLQILGFDDPNYSNYRDGFVEIVNYTGFVDRIFNLLNTRKVGLELSADLALEEGLSVNKLAKIDADINVDLTKLFDLSNLSIDSSLLEKNDEEVTKTLEDYLNDFAFNVDLSIEGKNDSEYSNLSLAFLENAAYISLNEDENNNAVMRSKLDVESMNILIDKVPSMISSLTEENADPEAASELFDFVTSSELVTAIKDGCYDGILDVLKTLKNTDSTIELELDLSSLGLGDNATVKLVLDSSSESTEVISLEIKNVKLGSLYLDLKLNTKEYSEETLNKVKTLRDANRYDDMKFITGIFNQVSSILDSKQAGFSLTGSVMDDETNGLCLSGNGQFDFGTKYGFGSLVLESKKDGKTSTHTIDLDVDNRGADNADKNMKFAYNKELRGNFTIETITDMIDLIKSIIESNDERFTKFLDPIKEMFIVGVIAEVVNDGDYISLTKSSLLKEIKQYNEGQTIRVTVGGEAIGLESDLVLDLNLENSGEDAKLTSISISDLVALEKTINIEIKLENFDPNKVTPVDLSKSFMDFSEIKVLLEFGINTTKLADYDLTASVSLSALQIINIPFDMRARIRVDGKHVYVYGAIDKIPNLGVLFSEDSLKNCKSEFVFEPTLDGSDDIGGYFHILRTEVGKYTGKTEKYYYKSTSKNFLDEILNYLLVDMLNLHSSIVTKINDAASDTSGNSEPQYENMFNENGFAYTHSDNKDEWDIGLDLIALTGNNSLGDVNISLVGETFAVDNKGYFSYADVSMKIIKIVEISAHVDLNNINPSATTWPQDYQNSYDAIVSIYNNMTDSKKASFNETYLNKPLMDYKVS